MHSVLCQSCVEFIKCSHVRPQLLTLVSTNTNALLPLMQDLTKDVFRIDAIPSQSLDTVREWLSSMDIKFYENKVNLNWKQVLKSIVDVSSLSICHCCLHATGRHSLHPSLYCGPYAEWENTVSSCRGTDNCECKWCGHS